MGQTGLFTPTRRPPRRSISKSCGFLESNQGGLFTSPNIPVRVYVVWGKSSYFPEILGAT